MCYRRILRKGRRVPESGPISDGAACAKVSACVRACVRACGRAWRGINNAAMAQGRPVLFFPFPSHVLVFGIFCFVVVCALCSTLAGWRTTTTTQRKVSQRCWTPPPPPPPFGGMVPPGMPPGTGDAVCVRLGVARGTVGSPVLVDSARAVSQLAVLWRRIR